MPKYSIIIPVYNVAPYLRECLDSVLGQTFADWECLCVDDGSTDESGVILDEYSQKDTRFRIFHKKNGGVGSARNCGITNANGDYILFLDADDTFILNALSELNKLLKMKTVDVLKFEWQRVRSHTDVTNDGEKKKYSYKCYDMSQVDDVKRVFKYFSLGGVLACCACFRTQLIKLVTFKKMPNGEDVLFGTEVICRAKFVAATNEVLYNYLNRPMSAVNTRDLRHLTSVIQMGVDIVEVVFRFKYYQEIKRIFYRKLWVLLFGDGWSILNTLPLNKKKEGRMLFSSAIETLCCDRRLVPGFVRAFWLLLFNARLQWVGLYLSRLEYLLYKKMLTSVGVRKIYLSVRTCKSKICKMFFR